MTSSPQQKSAEAGATTSRLLLFIGDQPTTPYAPILLERMARVKMLHTRVAKMIDKIRFVAQTNPTFRGERLVATAVDQVSDRMQYAVALKDAALAYFDNIQPLFSFADEMANAMFAIAGYQDRRLPSARFHVNVTFGVKPLQEFANAIYPRITVEFAELEKRRDKYDMTRAKGAAAVAQQHLIEQATLLDASLEQVGEHQMLFAKCIDIFARGECQLFKESKAVIDAVKAPDYKRSRPADTCNIA